MHLLGGICCMDHCCRCGGVTDRPVLPRPYWGSSIGDVQRRDGGLTPKSEVRLGVRKVPTGCPLWEEKGVTVLEGGRILARGTRFCT